jgi:hypothetical protein
MNFIFRNGPGYPRRQPLTRLPGSDSCGGQITANAICLTFRIQGNT